MGKSRLEVQARQCSDGGREKKKRQSLVGGELMTRSTARSFLDMMPSTLWVLGFLGRRDRRFTMARTTSARRHEAPTTRTCFAAAPASRRGGGKEDHFATRQPLLPPFCRTLLRRYRTLLHRVSCIVGCTHKLIIEPSPAQPRPPFELIATASTSASATPRFLHRPAQPCSCPVVLSLPLPLPFFLAFTPLNPHLFCLIFRLSALSSQLPTFISHLSILSSCSSRFISRLAKRPAP